MPMSITSTSVKKKKIRTIRSKLSITPNDFEDSLVEATYILPHYIQERTISKDSEASDEFRMTCETVVHFVQDFIAEEVDRQKRNADKNGRENGLLLNEGDQILLSMVNSRRYIVT